MKLVLEILSKELMPIEKKVNHIAKGRPLYITNEEWKVLSKWSSLEKGEPIIE